MREYLHTSNFMLDFIEGEERAFSALYNIYFKRLIVLAFELTSDEAEAEDIVIQSFTKIFARHGDFQSLPALRAFLYKTVKHSSFNYIKRVQRLENALDVLGTLFQEEEDLENAQLEGEMLDALYISLAQLPRECRNVLQLLYMQGMKYREVAETLHISIETVKSQRKYALNKLRLSMSAMQFLLLAGLFCMRSGQIS